jgi:hypothetical protein
MNLARNNTSLFLDISRSYSEFSSLLNCSKEENNSAVIFAMLDISVDNSLRSLRQRIEYHKVVTRDPNSFINFVNLEGMNSKIFYVEKSILDQNEAKIYCYDLKSGSSKLVYKCKEAPHRFLHFQGYSRQKNCASTSMFNELIIIVDTSIAGKLRVKLLNTLKKKILKKFALRVPGSSTHLHLSTDIKYFNHTYLSLCTSRGVMILNYVNSKQKWTTLAPKKHSISVINKQAKYAKQFKTQFLMNMENIWIYNKEGINEAKILVEKSTQKASIIQLKTVFKDSKKYLSLLQVSNQGRISGIRDFGFYLFDYKLPNSIQFCQKSGKHQETYAWMTTNGLRIDQKVFDLSKNIACVRSYFYNLMDLKKRELIPAYLTLCGSISTEDNRYSLFMISRGSKLYSIFTIFDSQTELFYSFKSEFLLISLMKVKLLSLRLSTTIPNQIDLRLFMPMEGIFQLSFPLSPENQSIFRVSPNLQSPIRTDLYPFEDRYRRISKFYPTSRTSTST